MAADRVPDAYMHNAKLSDEVISLRKQLAKANSIAAKASSTWDTFRKERDFHRMHHKRVVQVRHFPPMVRDRALAARSNKRHDDSTMSVAWRQYPMEMTTQRLSSEGKEQADQGHQEDEGAL